MKCMTSYILALVLATGTWTAANAQDEGATQDDGGVFVDENGDGIEDGFRKGRRGGRHGHRGGPALGAQLTEEQKAEVQVLVSGLKEEGATSEEIHAALAEFREANGIEAPERGNRGSLNLDPEVKAQIEQLKADGATREEIRAALAAQGVELPERAPRGNREGGRRRGGGRRSGR